MYVDYIRDLRSRAIVVFEAKVGTRIIVLVKMTFPSFTLLSTQYDSLKYSFHKLN